jgi:hypothetical protein
MVMRGNTTKGFNWQWAKLEGDRIYLPAHVVKGAQHAQFSGRDQISCSLLVVKPGRYRLLVRPEGPPRGDLAKILRAIDGVKTPGDLLTHTDDDTRDALPARLVDCTVSPPPPGWRLNLPKELRRLAFGSDEGFVYLLPAAGFIEIWFPDTQRRALSGPISGLL